jgi:glycosyltransferase involved in cell wall biosynthesis
MASKLFFSVIIATFNRSALIKQAIDSVFNQSFDEFELIVVDDGSSDDTRQVVNSYSDIRLHYHYIENSGVSAARNFGVSKSKGKYLVFLDSDDSLLPDALRDFYDSAEIYNHPEIVFSDLLIEQQAGNLRRICARDRKIGKSERGIFLTGAYSVKKDFFNLIGGFDENLKFGENTEIKIRVQQTPHRSSITEKLSVKYYFNSAGASKNFINRINSVEYTIAKHKEFFKRDRQLLKLFLQSNAVLLVKIGRLKEAKISIRRALAASPLDLKLVARVFLMHIPLLAKRIWKFSSLPE